MADLVGSGWNAGHCTGGAAATRVTDLTNAPAGGIGAGGYARCCFPADACRRVPTRGRAGRRFHARLAGIGPRGETR
ncbi:hypothetical protein DIE22_08710 [Burkholderia sp. Bp9142]|nr:hypothetical protein DIE22_08710 [Burkholderia sp. Bp9142]RQR48664.1 hypothetical protein DIE21_22395 [Burkholderia sp. Bp9140]